MSAAIQGIYIALFGRPADPGGLAYWTEATKGGTDLSAMLNVLPSLTEYTSRFDGMTPDQVITTVYQNLFGREPDAEGLAFFKGQLASGAQTLATIAVNIMQGAQGDDKADVDAKVGAAELFTASLDTPAEIAAYSGADAAALAKKFLDSVDKDAPATAESVEKASAAVVAGEDPTGGQAPGGGGGGGTPTPPAAAISDGKISIADGATVTVTETADTISIARAGFTTSTFAKSAVNEVAIAANAQVNINADSTFDDFTGTGTLNVTNVVFTDPSGSNPISAAGEYPGYFGGKVLVNGNQADAFKLAWIAYDAAYYANPDAPEYYDTPLNTLKVELAEAYVQYLKSGDGTAILDIVQTRAGGVPNDSLREQTLHNNILAELDNVTIADRFDTDPRNDDAKAFGYRPVDGGYKASATYADDAWDYLYISAARPDLNPDVITINSADFGDTGGLKWQTDRAAAGINWDDDAVTFTVNPAGTTTGHARWQGAKFQEEDGGYFDFEPGTIFSATLHVDASWATDGHAQQTGIWIQQQNDAKSLDGGGRFSIVEYVDATAAGAMNVAGFTGGFRFWNSDSGWAKHVNSDLSGDVNLTFGFFGSEQVWFVNGEEQYRYSGASTKAVDALETVIFNSVNFGGDNGAQSYTYSDIKFTGFEIA